MAVKVPQKITCCKPSDISADFLREVVLSDEQENHFLPTWELFVQYGQAGNRWMAVLWPNGCSSPNFPKMIEKGYLGVLQVHGGWLYGLTERGVERLLFHQREYYAAQNRQRGMMAHLTRITRPILRFFQEEVLEAA